MIELMTKIANQINAEKDEYSFEYSSTLVNAGEGPWVLVPNGVDSVAVTLAVSAGEGKIQISNDLDSVIRNSIPVSVDWPLGSVVSTVEDVCSPVSAIRQVNISGTTTLQMRAQ